MRNPLQKLNHLEPAGQAWIDQSATTASHASICRLQSVKLESGWIEENVPPTVKHGG
jgi:hypothetical protein